MITIQIAFLTGRFHATPWSRHVNEGAVEWPPSPWRLVRALLATGFSKLGWKAVPETARSLVGALAAHPPAISLPSGITSHTRHFMPPFKGNKDKVLDAFVDVGRAARIYVEWEVELGPAELALLDELLARLSYLGRAEAWTEARRIEAVDESGLFRCVAAASAPSPGYERVPLLAPVGESDYAAWRSESVAAELERALAQKQAAAQAKGKKPPAKLTVNDLRKISAAFPKSLLGALLANTTALQKEGWSQPPGSQWLSYWRDERTLAPAPAVTSGGHGEESRPTSALLALTSDTKNGNRLPLLTDAVLRLELLHKALVKRSDLGSGPSPALTGKVDDMRMIGHKHAVLVPLSLEEKATFEDQKRIDHVLVHAPMGLDRNAQRALRSVHSVYGRGTKYFVSLVGLGSLAELSSGLPALAMSKVWTSTTPFVPPRHLKRKGRNTLLGQVLAELDSRGLPIPTCVEMELEESRWIDLESANQERVRASAKWRHFRRTRLDSKRQPPAPRGFGLRLTFAEPIDGPLTLGYGSHFGLGVFDPEC